MKTAERILERQEKQNTRPILIACLGDSVTHGVFELEWYNDPDGALKFKCFCRPWLCYPMLLQRELQEKYPFAAVTVYNAGVNGDGTVGALARLERDVLSRQPDLVTVNLGLNDCNRGMEHIGEYAKNMGEIFDKIFASGSEVMLVTPNHMCAYHAKNLPDTEQLRAFTKGFIQKQVDGVLDAYVEAARNEAKKRNIPVADTYQLWDEMKNNGIDTTALLANGINHPYPEQHELFRNVIMQTLFDK